MRKLIETVSHDPILARSPTSDDTSRPMFRGEKRGVKKLFMGSHEETKGWSYNFFSQCLDDMAVYIDTA